MASSEVDNLQKTKKAHRWAIKPLMENKGNHNLEKEITLKDFIEDNNKLLQVLAILTTLSIFSANISLKELGGFISFLLLSASVLVWLELWARFPPEFGSWRLRLFETALSGIIMLVIAYWFLMSLKVAPSFASIAIFSLSFLIVNRFISEAIKKFGLFELIFKKRTEKRESFRYIFGIVVLLISFALAYYFSIIWLAPIINKITEQLPPF